MTDLLFHAAPAAVRDLSERLVPERSMSRSRNCVKAAIFPSGCWSAANGPRRR